MATVTDVEVANQSFPNVRQDLNDILEALATNFSADAEPTTTYPNQFWYETDSNLLYIRNEANDAWVTLASINQTSGEWEPRTAVIQAVDSAGLAFKTDDGTTRVSIADDGSVTINTSLDVDNIKIDGNSITSTDTNGDINITPDGSGKVVIDGLNYPTADGTDGQVLTTDGSGNIAFEDASGGGAMTLLSSQTASNDTYVIFDNTIITSDYKNYRLIAHAVTPATDQVNTRIWMSVDNGSTFNVSTIGGRQYNEIGGASSGHENTSGGGGETDISTSIGSDTDENIDYIIDFIGVGVSGSYTKLSYQCIGETQGGQHYNWKGASVFLSTSAVNYIRCGFASGNVESGQFFLYGVES